MSDFKGELYVGGYYKDNDGKSNTSINSYYIYYLQIQNKSKVIF